MITSTPEPAKARLDDRVDTSQMSVTQMYAYYKRTSHVGDVRFFIEHTRDSGLTLQAESILQGAVSGRLSKTETLQRLHILQDRWRVMMHSKPANSEARFWAYVRRQPRWYRAGQPKPVSTEDRFVSPSP